MRASPRGAACCILAAVASLLLCAQPAAAETVDFVPPVVDFGTQSGGIIGPEGPPPDLASLLIYGGTGEARQVEFRNLGPGAVTIRSIEARGVSLFPVCPANLNCPFVPTSFQCGATSYFIGMIPFPTPIVLQPGESCRFSLFHLLEGLGPVTAEFRVLTDSADSPHVLPVTALRYTYFFAAVTAQDRVTATVSIEAFSGCGLTAAAWLPQPGAPGTPSPSGLPPGVVFPHGLFQFEARPCTVGGARTVEMSFYPHRLAAGTTYWKFGPTPDHPSAHWYQIPMTMVDPFTLTITIVDGGLGDDDLTANGVIVDQGGPAIVVSEVPTLQPFWMLCAVGLLLISGVARLRRVMRVPLR